MFDCTVGLKVDKPEGIGGGGIGGQAVASHYSQPAVKLFFIV